MLAVSAELYQDFFGEMCFFPVNMIWDWCIVGREWNFI